MFIYYDLVDGYCWLNIVITYTNIVSIRAGVKNQIINYYSITKLFNFNKNKNNK